MELEEVSIVTPDTHSHSSSSSSSSSSSELVFSDDSSPESPKSPKSFALAALSALSSSFSPFAQPVFRTSSHSSLSSPPSLPSPFSGLQAVTASPSLPSFSDRQPLLGAALSPAGAAPGQSLFPSPSQEVQKLTHLSTLSQLICHLAQQSTHRKQDYATMLQFLRLISACDPALAARQGITVWTVEAAELIPPGVGSWMLVRGSERAVMKIGIGPNPGLKKYYWRDGSSKRFYKRETEGGVQDMSLVYIIQKASSASKRCVSIPGSDLWLILYLRATPPGSQCPVPSRTASPSSSSSSLSSLSSSPSSLASSSPSSSASSGHPFLTQSQESITEILLSLQKNASAGPKGVHKRASPPDGSSSAEADRPAKMTRRAGGGGGGERGFLDIEGALSSFGGGDGSPGSPPLQRSPGASQQQPANGQRGAGQHHHQHQQGGSADRVVQALVDSYNNHDIAGVMSSFDDNVEIYINGGEKISGHDAVRSRYQQIFRAHVNPSTILHRSVLGRRVVDHEWIGGVSQSAEVIAIYDIEDDVINKVWIFPYLPIED